MALFTITTVLFPGKIVQALQLYFCLSGFMFDRHPPPSTLPCVRSEVIIWSNKSLFKLSSRKIVSFLKMSVTPNVLGTGLSLESKSEAYPDPLSNRAEGTSCVQSTGGGSQSVVTSQAGPHHFLTTTSFRRNSAFQTTNTWVLVIPQTNVSAGWVIFPGVTKFGQVLGTRGTLGHYFTHDFWPPIFLNAPKQVNQNG